MKTSYSQNNTFKDCSQHWHLKYKEKLDGLTQGSSLAFGSAVDSAIMALLQGRQNYEKVFEDRWYTADSFGTKTQVFDNPSIVFAYNDFDEYVFKPDDITNTLFEWAEELGLDIVGTPDPIELYKKIAKKKKNRFKNPTQSELKYFNRASWLSMLRKGFLLINSFKEQFLPQITQVLDTQKYAYLRRPETGDGIGGFIDMVLKIKDYDKPIIFDLKTAGKAYSEEQIQLSEQLTLYSAMKAHEYGTDLTGFVVLVKNVPKIKVSYCSVCGHEKNGRHKTCNAEVNGVRCGGQWDTTVKLNPTVQVLVEQRKPEQVNALLTDYDAILRAMKNNIVYKNLDKCHNWYGGKCAFFEVCHNNDYSKVKKRGKK